MEELEVKECVSCGEEFEGEGDYCEECTQAIIGVEVWGRTAIHETLCDEYGAYMKDVIYTGDDDWNIDGDSYLVLDEDNATIKARDYIEQTLWAFNSSFLADATGLPEKVFRALAEDYEDSNETIRELIDKLGDFDDFCDEAISSDGIMHFVQDEANEIYVNGRPYYVFPQ